MAAKINYPSIQDYTLVTDAEIFNGANIAAQAAVSALSYQAYGDVYEELCCAACRKAGLIPKLKKFYEKGKNKQVGQVNFGDQEILGQLVNSFGQDMCAMRLHFKICSAEAAAGILLFVNLCKKHWLCTTFQIFRPTIPQIFVTCMMIAHKISMECPMGNKWWAVAFGMQIKSLNEFERTILIMMDYRTTVHNRQYDQFVEAMCGYEFGPSTRLGKYLDGPQDWECQPKR
ncbi:MAG: hypothetical protein EZS28_034765 [Streblomastix strix]|uniref:Cyclin N-terminal domain-containing protein n=1 Tax=Streblomastix strix TaxID=222440 RepID=A0A5J4UH28_9EUKA|nr:MAG: hypothetical protein EZS28_034765 [Streblomastix strix]